MSERACIDSGDWAEPSEFFSSKTTRARKPHQCGECGAPINAGDLYERCVGKTEGDFWDFVTCARCVNIRRDYFASCTLGMMVEDFREAHGFDYRDGLPPDFGPCTKAKP